MNTADDWTFQLTRNSPFYEQEKPMLQRVDWGAVPDSSDTLPGNLYYLQVDDVAWEYSQNGKLCLKKQLRVLAPETFKNSVVFDRVYVGTDEDPAADQPETWARRAGSDIKKFLVGVFGDVAALSGDIAADVEATRGAGVLCLVDHEIDNRQYIKDKDTGAQVENPYYGQERNRFKKWFPVNDAEAFARVGLMEKPAPAAPRASTPAPRPPAAPPVAAPAPAPAPAPPAAPPVAAPPAAPAPARTVAARPPAPAAPPRPAPPAPPRPAA